MAILERSVPVRLSLMESVVDALEAASREAADQIDEIEQRIRISMPDTAPLLDLCAQLRSARIRILALKLKISELGDARDLLQKNLGQYLAPASQAVKNACIARNLPAPRIRFGSPTAPQAPVEDVQPVKLAPSPAQSVKPAAIPAKPVRATSPKPVKAVTLPLPVCQMREITEEEFASLDTRTMGHITMVELCEVYQFIWSFFNEQDHRNATLTRKVIADSGIRMRALPTALRFLKSLRRIDLTKQGDVKWLSQ
jgi:hypothetical protein